MSKKYPTLSLLDIYILITTCFPHANETKQLDIVSAWLDGFDCYYLTRSSTHMTLVVFALKV